MLEKWTKYLEQYETNGYFIGIMLLIANIGSRYLALELSPNQEAFLNLEIVRKFLIFAVCFSITRKLTVSLLLTAAFTTLVGGLFHEESRFCIMPEHYKNKKSKPSEIEVRKARDVLKRHEDV